MDETPLIQGVPGRQAPEFRSERASGTSSGIAPEEPGTLLGRMPYQVFTEHMRDGAVMLTPHGIILYCNPRFAALLKRSAESLAGSSFYDLISSEEQRKTLHTLLNHFTFNNCTCGIFLTASDGTPLPIGISLHQVHNPGTSVICAIITFRDVMPAAVPAGKNEDAARQALEQAIALADRRARDAEETVRLVEAVSDYILRFDRQRRIIYANPAFASMSGVRREGILGRSCIEMGVPERYAAEWEKAMQRVLEDGNEHEAEFVHPSAFTNRVFQCRFIPEKGGDGTVRSIICIFRDVTAVKKAREALENEKRKYETLAENFPEAMTRFDREFRYLYINPAAERLLGHEREELLGKSITEIGALPEILAPVRENISRVFETGKERDVELVQWGRALNVRYVPEFDDRGQVVSVLAISRDVTELKISQERLSLILESISDGFFALDRSWRFTYINKRAAGNLGLEPADLIGKNIWEKFPFTVGTEHEKQYRAVMQDRVPASFELWGSGHDRCYSINVYPSEDGISVFWTDITGRVQAEEALLEAHQQLEARVLERTADLSKINEQLKEEIRIREEIERYQEASHALLYLLGKTTRRAEYLAGVLELLAAWSGCSSMGIRFFDEKGGMLYAAHTGNFGAACETECPPEQGAKCRVCPGVAAGERFPGLTDNGSFCCASLPDAAPVPSEAGDAPLDACIRNGFRSVAVIPLLHKDRYIGVIHLADERPGQMTLEKVGFIESLTPLIGEGINKYELQNEIRQSQELLEKIFSNTNLLIACLDTEFNFMQVNEAYARADGKTPGYFTGKNHFTLFPNEENERIFRQVKETGIPYAVFARPFKYSANPERGESYWDWNLHPLKDASGRVEGLILCLVDVTRRKQAEEDLLNAQKELEVSRRLSDIGKLAATMAHEMRNPLAGIKTAAYNLKRKTEDPRLDKHFSTIDKKINESDHIIQNLLSYSRIKSINPETLHAANLLRECVAEIGGKYPDWDVNVEEDYDGSGDSRLEADSLQLRMLFCNILDNAYQALPDKRGTIRVSAQFIDSRMEVRVSDSGAGIDPEDLGRIFEPFFTKKSKGAGLGLTLCREIVTLHNGTIEVESGKGRGTTFTVILPRANGAAEKDLQG